MSKFTAITGIFGFLGVMLGAFGAHGLEDHLSHDGQIENWRTATLYLFVHTLALFILSTKAEGACSKSFVKIAWLWTFGILIFSGSLYILAITGISKLGMITPIGGICFLLGWILLAWSGFRSGRVTIENS